MCMCVLGVGRNDEDANLIPLLVDRLVIPHVTDFVKYVWNPWSSVQSKAVLTVVQVLVSHNSFPFEVSVLTAGELQECQAHVEEIKSSNRFETLRGEVVRAVEKRVSWLQGVSPSSSGRRGPAQESFACLVCWKANKLLQSVGEFEALTGMLRELFTTSVQPLLTLSTTSNPTLALDLLLYLKSNVCPVAPEVGKVVAAFAKRMLQASLASDPRLVSLLTSLQ